MSELEQIKARNKAFLDKNGKSLQANIFISRRKNFAEMLFLHLEQDGDREALKQVLAQLAINSATATGVHLTSFQNQLDVKTKSQHKNGLFCNLFLSADGLTKLGTDSSWTDVIAHLEGNRQDLDVELPKPDPKYGGEKSIDAVLLLAHNVKDALPRWRRSFEQEIFPRIGVELLFVEEAQVYRNNTYGDNRERGLVVEHFGYADGASNPCITVKELEQFETGAKRMDEWNPGSTCEEFLVVEPGDPKNPSYGSFLVFRKMEQDVSKFNRVIEDLAVKLGKTQEEAGALVFGRRRNATSLEKNAQFDASKLNDFHYPANGKCPFFAHVRKMNPRAEGDPPGLPRNYQKPNPIIRRGITYGQRSLRYGSLDVRREPREEVGLFFMSFQKDIDDYQQILQSSWTGGELDPILGHLDDPTKEFEHNIPGLSEPYRGLGGFVHMRGGLNLYAPSLPFFKNLINPSNPVS